MARSLIDGAYDLYLQKSGNGSQFDVPIHIRENGNIEEISIRVWAKDSREAEERALAKAHSIDFSKQQKIQDKSLGVILPVDHYKPSGIYRTVTSPFAVWRDPVYKKGAKNILNGSVYKAGTMTKLSFKGLMRVFTNSDTDEDLTREYLEKAHRVNIITFFIWLGFSLVGLMFLLLGFHPGYEDRFIISWLNQYIISGIVCISVGTIAVIKTYKDYQWISNKLNEYEDIAEEEHD